MRKGLVLCPLGNHRDRSGDIWDRVHTYSVEARRSEIATNVDGLRHCHRGTHTHLPPTHTEREREREERDSTGLERFWFFLFPVLYRGKLVLPLLHIKVSTHTNTAKGEEPYAHLQWKQLRLNCEFIRKNSG